MLYGVETMEITLSTVYVADVVARFQDLDLGLKLCIDVINGLPPENGVRVGVQAVSCGHFALCTLLWLICSMSATQRRALVLWSLSLFVYVGKFAGLNETSLRGLEAVSIVTPLPEVSLSKPTCRFFRGGIAAKPARG